MAFEAFTMVFESGIMAFEAFTPVFESGAMASETKTEVSRPNIIFGPTGTTVFLAKERVCIAKAIVAGAGTMVYVKNPLGAALETTTKAAKKMVQVAQTTVGIVN